MPDKTFKVVDLDGTKSVSGQVDGKQLVLQYTVGRHNYAATLYIDGVPYFAKEEVGGIGPSVGWITTPHHTNAHAPAFFLKGDKAAALAPGVVRQVKDALKDGVSEDEFRGIIKAFVSMDNTSATSVPHKNDGSKNVSKNVLAK